MMNIYKIDIKRIILVLLWTVAFMQIMSIIGFFSIVFTEMMHNPSYHGGVPDFTVFWSAGQLALQGHAVDAYNIDILRSYEQNLFPGITDAFMLPLLNPPVFFFYFLPFSLFSYEVASILWWVLLTIFCLFTLWRLAPQRWMVIFPVLFSVWPYYNSATLGQTAIFYTALWGGIVICFISKKKILAGFFIALLIYKPQSGILIPIALIIGREWRILASACIFSCLFIVSSWLVWGGAIWVSFFESSFNLVNEMLINPDQIVVPLHWFYGVYGFLHYLGFSYDVAIVVHWGSVAFYAVTISIVWSRRNIPVELKLCVLILCSVFASYYVLAYDLLALMIPGTILFNKANKENFYRFEALSYLIAVFSGFLIYAVQFPIFVFPWTILVVLTFLRIQDVICAKQKITQI